MKKLFVNIMIMSSIALTGCNDSFLDKSPVTDLTEENAFNTYDNFKTFMWPCYEIFTNTTIRTSLASGSAYGSNGQYTGDVDAGYFQKNDVAGYNEFANQVKGSVATGNGWDFKSFIRRVNIMWSHLDGSQMTQEEKDHWKAVGNFFHSFWYMELIDRFGDVPWIDTVLDENSPEAYGPRISRDIVAKNVLTNLQWAADNIGDFNDGENTINRECILFAISRFGLREGTWRKYHGLGGETEYLEACIAANRELMQAHPTLYTGTDASPASGYGEMWTTEDLKDVPGIIFYKSYVANINPHGACHVEHTSSHPIEMNQFTVDLYLMKNGKPILNSASGYEGQYKDMYHIFRNRDPRLYQTVMPPYKVNPGKADYPTWGWTGNAADREYIDIMGKNESCSNPGIGMKRLPGQNWSGSLVAEIPRLGTGAFVMCRSGYYVWKNWDNWEQNFNNGNVNTSDKPIFKIEEILLNEAEAQYELNGSIDQLKIDETINKLRNRAGVERMILSEIDDSFDPNRGMYYPKDNNQGVKVDPVLWEIRRERIVELMGEGFGFYDVRRWRMAPWFLNRETVGTWVTKEAANAAGLTLYNPATGNSDGVNGSLTEGNIFLFAKPKGWLEKYYLYQVPTTEIVLNDKLTQNPGW